METIGRALSTIIGSRDDVYRQSPRLGPWLRRSPLRHPRVNERPSPNDHHLSSSVELKAISEIGNAVAPFLSKNSAPFMRSKLLITLWV